MIFLDIIKENYDYIFYELADARTRDLFPSGITLITLLSFYLYFVLSLGPRLMRDVKPFMLKSILFYYNLFQICACMCILPLGLFGGWFTTYSYACQPVDYTDNPETRNMLIGVWYYLVIKLVDWFDTVFFILRKNDRQITFLHVFHHSMMPIGAFICLKYYPNGHATAVGVINTFVHIVMYSYYFIAGLGPQYKKYLWWKKYLTAMQIVQFFLNFIHNMIPLLIRSCNYPKWISLLICINNALFVYMFGKFYYVSYVKPSGKNINNNDVNVKSKEQ